MKTSLILVFLLLPLKLLAVSEEALKKYPYQLLTNDYGILNEANLKRYADGIIPKPFKWDITGFDYWQCFPTKNVTVWYEQGEYDSDEKVTRGAPHITVKINPGLTHDYQPRRNFSLKYAKNKVVTWKRLLKDQKYVCLGGAFAGTYKKIENWQGITEHGWIFENLKTKKGCDSYFSGWCQ